MARLLVIVLVSGAFLVSCQSGAPGPRTKDFEKLQRRALLPWWRQLNDPALSRDIDAALSANPGLQAVAYRLERAAALREQAGAVTLPQVNVGLGFEDGRRRAIDFGPFDLGPWRSEAIFSWEVDLTGKFKAARQAAVEMEKAAEWDHHLARLLLASRLAVVRLNLYRYNAELEALDGSLAASRQILVDLDEQARAGMIADSVLDRQKAENERLLRQRHDLQRLRDLAVVQLRTLRGGSAPSEIDRAGFPEPDPISDQGLDQWLAAHPKLRAEAARVRAAFDLEQSARLDLLPSFRVGALATGRQMSLTSRFMTWIAQVGPSLEIPVYDPARLARVKVRQAEAKLAAADYRQAVLEVLADLDSARINFAGRSRQLAGVVREGAALDRARKQAREQFEAGLTAQIEFLDTERRWLETRRSEAMLRQALLVARVDLIKASGGGP